jgi:hypothetical protein
MTNDTRTSQSITELVMKFKPFWTLKVFHDPHLVVT